MTYEQIEEVNGVLKTRTIDIIEGTKYMPVSEQIKGFRMLHPNGKIETEMSFIDEETVCFRASVYSEMGELLATATAYEISGGSYIEICETIAIARALTFCGIGVDTSIRGVEAVQEQI